MPLKNFAPIFALATKLGLPFTCHAGDSQGPDTVRDAMDFGAKRIGHGHHIADDEALCRRAVRDGVTLEICPTSNIQCQSQPSYAAHPAKRLLVAGLRVTINTDNMILSGIDLDIEYDHCLNDMGFSRADLVKMLHYSADAAFVSETERQALHAKIDAAQ
ncbi:Aminodeoxyfutalosine deaminase [bioreactor metagenome]|uniref:adenosine deaminase n=1 Tax=bioreactor metagenome TaxID=1076179 RepID=A0A645FGB9_9ZZZZ